MNLPVDMGDVPSWLAVLGPAGVAAVHQLPARRRARVDDLVAKVQARVELDAEAIATAVLESPELEELVNRVITDAANTTWEEMLDGLASVLAAAVEGDDTTVSMQLLVESVLSRIQRAHVQALRLIREHQPLLPSDLRALWPGAASVLESLLAWLAAEGLLRNIAAGTYDGVEGKEKWIVTPLGEHLVMLLQPDAAASQPILTLKAAQARGDDRSWRLTVRNVGTLAIDSLTVQSVMVIGYRADGVDDRLEAAPDVSVLGDLAMGEDISFSVRLPTVLTDIIRWEMEFGHVTEWGPETLRFSE